MSDDFSIPNPAYHAYQRRDEDQESGTRRLAIIAGGIVAGLVVLYSGFSYFGHRPAAPPTIAADPNPWRVRPADPGGMRVAGAGNEFVAGDGDTSGSQLAPAAEVPDPKALRAQMAAPRITTPQPPAPAMMAPPMAAAPIAPPMPPPLAPASPARAPQAHASLTPAPAALAPALQAPALQAPALQTPALQTPALAAPKATPSTIAKPAPVVAPPAALPSKTTAATGKSPAIQLAALTSEAAAKAEWQILQKRMPALLKGRTPAISKTERDGKTFWRVRTGGFTDTAQAKAFCENVRAKGGACSVAEF